MMRMNEMIASRKIAYLFSTSDHNDTHFAFCVELAKRLNKELVIVISASGNNQCNGSVEQSTDMERQKQTIYYRLLDLKGKYQALYNGWKNKIPVKINHVISEKPIADILKNVMVQKNTDLVLFNEINSDVSHKSIRQLIKRKGPTPIIALPEKLHFPPAVHLNSSKAQQLFYEAYNQLGIYNAFEDFNIHFQQVRPFSVWSRIKNSCLNLVNDR
jgi:hypothetical protein